MKIIALPYDEATNPKYKNINSTPWIWIDGKLAKINGYDLCYVEDVPTQEGIYDYEVDINGNLYRAKLFYWHSIESDGEYGRWMGYVSDVNDPRSLALSQLKYDSKSPDAVVTRDEAKILMEKGLY